MRCRSILSSGWIPLWLVCTAFGQAAPENEAAAVVRVPEPPLIAAHRGPDRTIDVYALDRIERNAFSPGGRTLWLLGWAYDWDDRGAERTKRPRLVGLDIASGVISHDLDFPLRHGAWDLDKLVVADDAVWVKGTLAEPPPPPPPTDPRQEIESAQDRPRFLPVRSERRVWGFAARCPTQGPDALKFWFTPDEGYAAAAGRAEDAAARPRWSVETLSEYRDSPQRYRVSRPDPDTPLEVHSPRPANLFADDDGLLVTLFANRGGGHGTLWRLNLNSQTWGWPRKVRRGRLNPPLAVSPDGRCAAAVGIGGRSNRVDLYLFDDAERYDAQLAARMAAVLEPPPSAPLPAPSIPEVTLPGPDAEPGAGPDTSFALADLGQPQQLRLEPGGSRAYVVYRLTTGSAYPAPTEDRVRCIDLASGQTVWDTASPFTWERRHNNHASTGLIVDPHYLVLSHSYPTRHAAVNPNPFAQMYRQTRLVVLRKDTGARVGVPVTTAVHDTAVFLPVAIAPPDPPGAGPQARPRSDRLVLVYHTKPWAHRYGQLDLSRQHWRIERWELPNLRRRVLMRSDEPGLLDHHYTTFQPRPASFALEEDGRTVVGHWQASGRGDGADRRFAETAVLRFDADTGRRLGTLPLPPFGDKRFLRGRASGGLWRVVSADSQTEEYWRIDEHAAKPTLRLHTNGWRDDWFGDARSSGSARWLTIQNDRRGPALVRLDPWTGRVDGPRAVSGGDDTARLLRFSGDGSAAVALTWPRQPGQPGQVNPQVTLHRYDFPPASRPPALDVIAVPFREALRGEADRDPVIHTGDVLRMRRRFLMVGGERHEVDPAGDRWAKQARPLRPEDLEPLDLDFDALGPGDFLRVSARGEGVKETQHAVDENGDIELAGVGTLRVAGLTPEEVARNIESEMPDATGPGNVEVTAAHRRQHLVTIIPHVAEGSSAPLVIIPDGDFRFSELIETVGGLPEDTQAVYILRTPHR